VNSLDCLFKPRSLALIGASADEKRLGGVVLRNLRAFRGKFYPVNPNYTEIDEVPVYASIRDLPETVDLSVILRPAPEVPELLAAHAGKARCAIIVSAGFAETGCESLQQEVVRLGRELGIRLLGPNCLGVFAPYQRLDTLFLPRERLKRPKKGNVAVVSQSGALLLCLLETLAVSGRGVSLGVNYGNAADIDAADIYDYLAEDLETGVVISYLESMADGRRFVAAAEKLAQRKPLLILKAGKGESGQRAAYSHTGRLAGKYEVFSSIMRQSGIREVRDLDELLDAGHALARQRPSRGNRICIVTNAGGLGVLAVDECARHGIEITPLPEAIRQRLHNCFPPFYSVANPIDLTGQVKDDEYLATLNEIQDEYDGFLVIAHTGVVGLTLRLAELLTVFRAASGKPLVAYLAPGGITDQLAKRLEKGEIPVYPSPERAVRGLSSLMNYGQGPCK